MAINGVTGTGFNPYALPGGVDRAGGGAGETGALRRGPREEVTGSSGLAQQPAPQPAPQPAQDVAAAVKQDAAGRAALVASAKAPDGVDQELWSILTKEERAFFVKAGAMGPLTYSRSPASQGAAAAPLMRGGRLDIRA